MRGALLSAFATRSGRGLSLAAVAITALALLAVSAQPSATQKGPYSSPLEVAFSPAGKALAVSDFTGGALALFDPATGKQTRTVALADPMGLVWSGEGRVFVAEQAADTVAEVDASTGRVARRLKIGPRPSGVALAAKRQLLLVTRDVPGYVSGIALATGKEQGSLAIAGQPCAVALTPDETLAVVASLLPSGNATDPQNAAKLTLVSLPAFKRAAEIRLPAGATGVRGVTLSPDGRWAYVVHALGRFNVPTTQLERGWVNTNALSIVDLAAKQHYATVLLDHPAAGATDPYGVAVAREGETLWVSLGGVHQVAKIDLKRLHPMLEGKMPEGFTPNAESTWLLVQQDPKQRALLTDDLSALHGADLITKTPLPGNGPRGIALSPDGKLLAVAMYYSGEVHLADPAGLSVTRTLALGPKHAPDPARLGEMIFHDATYCFQHWLSCSTCHPEGRADGLNWDLVNDGIGNPKNTKSMLLSHKTPPTMSHGIRANMEVAALAGFRYIQFREPGPGEAEAVQAYIRSLRPAASPYLAAGGKLSPAAQRGKAIFESSKTRCASCHPAPLFTNMRLYDVGTRGATDTDSRFDTPTLVEVWRTAPYLHDGSAPTLRDVITKNKGDKHGVTSHLTPAQVDDLVAYLQSL